LPLATLRREVTSRCSGWYSSDDAGASTLVDERPCQDGDGTVDRGSDRILANEVGSPDSRLHDHAPALLRELPCREFVQDPSFLADLCDDIRGIRIHPEIRLPVDGLRSY